MKRTGNILLVDDDPSLLRLLSLRLEGEGHVVRAEASADLALQALADFPADCVITDLRMSGMDGLDLLEQLGQLQPSLPVILLTAHGSIPDAVNATRGGALDFLTKPIDKQTLLARVDQALTQTGTPRAAWQDLWQDRIITHSPLMKQLLEEARLVADTDTSVLIQGESGTGKEVLARLVHEASPRHDKPFVAINCGAMPEQLLESELFGHVRGAFTDAHQAREGLLRSAEGGTVFLDEIGDMPQPLQVKLLRVLQEREVRPVGGQQVYPINIRILSATHRDVMQLIDDTAFREDLYYRLAVVTLRLPPLRERPEDIAPLCRHFLERIARQSAKRSGIHPKLYAPEATELLLQVDWPGNIRQLANIVEQNAALSRGHVIGKEVVAKALDRQGKLQPDVSTLPSLATARDAFVRDYLIQLLQITEGNVSRAARLAQRNRTEFYKLLARHDLSPADFKT